MSLNKDIKVGSLLILSIIIFGLAYYYMKGTLLHSGDPEYSAIFQSVEKLKKSDKVYLNGVVVGMITSLEFPDINKPEEIKLTFSADKRLKIPRDSKLQIVNISLMGNSGLALHRGISTDIISPGDIIGGLPEAGMFDKLTPLAGSSDTLMRKMNTLFDRNQNENVYVMIGELNKTLATMNTMIGNTNKMLVDNQKPIHQTMVNFEKMSAALYSKQSDIQETIKNIREITGKTNQADIAGMLKKLDKSMGEMNSMMYEINNGNGSITKLMKDPVLYNNLNATVSNANELMIDFKANPKRYVGFSIFGAKK